MDTAETPQPIPGLESISEEKLRAMSPEDAEVARSRNGLAPFVQDMLRIGLTVDQIKDVAERHETRVRAEIRERAAADQIALIGAIYKGVFDSVAKINPDQGELVRRNFLAAEGAREAIGSGKLTELALLGPESKGDLLVYPEDRTTELFLRGLGVIPPNISLDHFRENAFSLPREGSLGAKPDKPWLRQVTDRSGMVTSWAVNVPTSMADTRMDVSLSGYNRMKLKLGESAAAKVRSPGKTK